MKLLEELISTPSPSGMEGLVRDIVLRELDALSISHDVDGKGNVWATVGDKAKSLFTAHMDCIHNTTPVEWEIKEGLMKLKVGCFQEALGSDDKAGIAILMHMIAHDVGGTYLFTVEEEVGCVGAKHAAESCPAHIKQAICFDRKGKGSVITDMSGGPSCSDAFSEGIIAGLLESNMVYVADPTGSTTDTNAFRHQTLNHTNISVGYENEHTQWEELDVAHFLELKDAVLKVDWEGLSEEERPAISSTTAAPWWERYDQTGPTKVLINSFSFDEACDNLMEWVGTEGFVTTAEVEDIILGLQELHDVETSYEFTGT